MLGIIEAMRQSHSIVPGKADVGGGTRCVKLGMDSSSGRDQAFEGRKVEPKTMCI